MKRAASIMPRHKEAYFLEWKQMLDKALLDGSSHDVERLHKVIALSLFGSMKFKKFIDIRIHMRLAKLYLQEKKYLESISQFNLFLQAIPNDLNVLHLKALSYIEIKDYKACSNLIKRTEKLDADIMKWNMNWAGLKGRWNREQWKLSGDKRFLKQAKDVYETAAIYNPASFYMADAAGQCNLQLGAIDRAQSNFKKSLSIINTVKQPTIWSSASKLTALIFLNNENEVEKELLLLRNLKPDPRSTERIERTIDEISSLAGVAPEKINHWKKILTKSDN